MAQAVERIQKTANKEIPASSIEFFLFGQGAVQADLLFYSDLLSKDHELRLTSSVYFVKGTSAEEVLAVVEEGDSVGVFSAYGVNAGITAFSSQMPFTEYLQNIAENSAFAVPTVAIVQQDEKRQLLIEGYAIVRDCKFQGYIEGRLARGYNMVKNLPTQSGVLIPAEGGRQATLELERAQTDIHFVFEGGRLAGIRIQATISGDALDVGALPGIRDAQVLQRMEALQGDVIRREVEGVVNLAKATGSDFLGIGARLKMLHPYRWAQLESTWPDVFVSTPVQVEVRSRVQRSYDLVELRSE